MSDIVIHRKTVKTAIRKNNLSGSFIVGKYRFSPYMACQHGCAYCDGRSERYFVEGDFERDIIARTNLPELIGVEIPKLREKGFITIGSGITDAYQPIERDLELTRKCAEALTEFNSPASIMKKSDLAIRDLNLWSKVGSKAGFLFMVSLTFADDGDRKIFEPGASSVEARIESLIRFKEAGCYTGVLAMPLLPFIGDTDANLDALYTALAATGVDFIMPAGLTLRPGRQKDHFFKVVGKNRPELLLDYEKLYAENRDSGAIVAGYAKRLVERCGAFSRKYDIPFLVPHYVYRDRIHIYDEVNVLLAHMIELYESRGVDTKPLQKSRSGYMAWITEQKKAYNRRRSLSYRKLDWELRDAVSSGKIESIVGNEKLGGFIDKIVIGREIFDYRTLKLASTESTRETESEFLL